MSEQDQQDQQDQQGQLPDVAPVQLADDAPDPELASVYDVPADQVDAIDPEAIDLVTPGREQDDPKLRAWLQDGEQRARDAAQALLRDRELEDGAKVSDRTSGCWAVYDNSELRFWPGLPVHRSREQAQRDLDELRPTTGHDLVVVEV